MERVPERRAWSLVEADERVRAWRPPIQRTGRRLSLGYRVAFLATVISIGRPNGHRLHSRQSREGVSVATRKITRDRDTKYGTKFRKRLGRAGCASVRLPICTPQLNIYAERWIKSCRRECLDHFVAFGERQLGYLLRQYVAYYHKERPHQGLDNGLVARDPRRLIAPSGPPPPPTGSPPIEIPAIACRQRLGGVLKHYERKAA